MAASEGIRWNLLPDVAGFSVPQPQLSLCFLYKVNSAVYEILMVFIRTAGVCFSFTAEAEQHFLLLLLVFCHTVK